MQPGGNSIEVAEVSKTLSGLLAHRYYAGTDRNDTVIRTLQEVANELAWIIHGPSAGIRFVRRKGVGCPEQADTDAHRGSKRPKRGSPYSPAKLALVNNPG